MTSKTENPFDEKSTGLKIGDETKTDNKVVETPGDKAGTAKDKPADAPDEIQNADGSKEPDPAKTDDGKSEDAPKPKTTRKRRTKAQIEADKAKEEQGGELPPGDLVDVEDHTFDELDFEKLPLSAQSGNIVGSVDLNQGAVPTLNISLQGWIGAPIIAIAASQIGDVESVLNELKKQAKKIKL